LSSSTIALLTVPHSSLKLFQDSNTNVTSYCAIESGKDWHMGRSKPFTASQFPILVLHLFLPTVPQLHTQT